MGWWYRNELFAHASRVISLIPDDITNYLLTLSIWHLSEGY